MKTIVLGNATIVSGNRGCVALSYCVMYIVDDIIGRGNYKLYLTDSGENNGEHWILVAGKKIQYEAISLPSLNNFKELIKCFFHIKKLTRALSIVNNADLVLDVGQGDSFSDIYGKNRFERIDLVHKIARLFNVPYIFLPQTIGPFDNEKIKIKANHSIINSKFCMVRDKQSLDYVIENVPEKKEVKDYIDVAFLLPYKVITQNESYIHIGLNISALLWNGGYTHKNQFCLQCDYRKLVKNIIDYFLVIPHVKIHLISHVVGQERNVENDYQTCYELWKEYKDENIILSPFALDPMEIKSYIAGMDFFMGARMHATIAAFSSGVPVVPMAYSRKFNGLFVDTLQYPYIVDLKNMTNKEIINTIKDSFINRNELSKTIDNRLKGIVKDRTDALYTDLTKFLK